MLPWLHLYWWGQRTAPRLIWWWGLAGSGTRSGDLLTVRSLSQVSLKAQLWSEKMTASVLSPRCGLNQKRDKPPWIMIAKHLAVAAWVKPNTMAQNVRPLFLRRLVFDSYPRVHGKLSAEVTCACPSNGEKMSWPARMFLQLFEILPALSNVISNEKANIFSSAFSRPDFWSARQKGVE